MKLKTFYMLALICCMGFFSSAEQSNTNCDKKSHCMLSKQDCPEQAPPQTTGGMGFDLSPIRLFVSGI